MLMVMCVGGRVKLANDITYKRFVYRLGRKKRREEADAGYTG